MSRLGNLSPTSSEDNRSVLQGRSSLLNTLVSEDSSTNDDTLSGRNQKQEKTQHNLKVKVKSQKSRVSAADVVAAKNKNRKSSITTTSDTNEMSERQPHTYPVDHEEPWTDVDKTDAMPTPGMYVTRVPDSQLLQKMANRERAVHSEFSSTEEWLDSHGIENLRLSFKDLMDHGHVSADVDPGKPAHFIKFEAGLVNEFEARLNESISEYHQRIKWLLQGSRRRFGVVKHSRVAVLIDCSNTALNYGRLAPLQRDLEHLFEQQLSSKETVFLMTVGSDVDVLFDEPMVMSYRVLCECNEFIGNITPAGGCNLIKAFDRVLPMDIDTILLIMGSSADQKTEVVCSFIEQKLLGRQLPLQVVSYNCTSPLAVSAMHQYCEISNGRFHCYNSEDMKQAYAGTDLKRLLEEIASAREILEKIKEMRQGMIGEALISVVSEINSEIKKLPATRFLPRPPNHTAALEIQQVKFSPKTSADWLSKNGLKAKKLNLYQVLAPNAFDFVEDYVPVLNKRVRSTNYHKHMVQFEWHDKTVKNIHVDPALLYDYQKRLAGTVDLFEKRIDWLSSASRQMFGTVVENRVIFLIDASEMNGNYIIHVQHSFRQMLQEQMSNKLAFNIIRYGSIVECWKPKMVPPTEKNLQSAWRWILGLDTYGSRNVLSALRTAVENQMDDDGGQSVEGIYIFTSGVPDQFKDVACEYVTEISQSRSLNVHCILYNVDDDRSDGFPGRYANIKDTADYLRDLSHASGGRFHWFRETGIIESDDVKLVMHEMDKTVKFSQKCNMLVEALKKKYPHEEEVNEICTDVKALPAKEPKPIQRAITPKETKSSIARRLASTEKPPISGKGPWKPASNVNGQQKNIIPRLSSDCSLTEGKKSLRATQESFLLENGKKIGQVYKSYESILDKKPKIRKQIKKVIIPDIEELLTTKDWMKKYGLAKLKLDLYSLVNGPDCKHDKQRVSTLTQPVEAVYCKIFPSIEMGGTVRHLQLTLNELWEYRAELERALKRYIKRLTWLLNGSHLVFGTVIEKRVVFLLDISGSMEAHMADLKRHLIRLIWDQLQRNSVRFNLIAYSNGLNAFSQSPGLVEPSDECCHAAVHWLSRLQAGGSTCTLDALLFALNNHTDADAVYLVTDGKPDTSCSLVLREIARVASERANEGGKKFRVHTISFNCEDSVANTFLRQLAAETRGRFHTFQESDDSIRHLVDVLQQPDVNYTNVSLPEFHSDDIHRLGAEISLCVQYLIQSQAFCEMYSQTAKPHENLTRSRSELSNQLAITPKILLEWIARSAIFSHIVHKFNVPFRSDCFSWFQRHISNHQ